MSYRVWARALLVIVSSNQITFLIHVIFKLFSRMGILGLTKFIADAIPHVIKENEIKNYFG